MNNKTISIGSRVITRKFETSENLTFLTNHRSLINQEGIVERVSKDGNYFVNGLYWPPSAVELAFQPEYGKEYEFTDYIADNDRDGYDTKWSPGIFMLKDNDIYVVKRGDNYHGYKHCRPIRKGLEDRIRTIIEHPTITYQEPGHSRKVLIEIMDEIKHRTEPSEKEIRDFYYDNHNVVDTVRHFLKQGI